MTFQDAIRICFQKYAVISGRARRAEYWWWVLFTLIAGLVLSTIDGVVFGTTEDSAALLGPLFSLATLLPSICVAGRRLHDRDMSAWWLLLILIPVLGFLILLVIFVLPGTPGANRFGPDPLGGGRPDNTGRRPSVRDEDDETFTKSSIPRSGQDRDP